MKKKKKNQSEMRKPRGRFQEEERGGEEMIRCSGKHCGACCGGYVADCVAVCCCPCAVLHCCVLALVKGPSLVGRKCLGMGKKKNDKSNKKGFEDVVERVESSNVCGSGSGSGSGGGEIMDGVTANVGFDAEKVWRELYQIGHLDFGRVSSSHDD